MAAKRRGRGEGSIYKLKNGRWRAEITLAIIGGKQIRKSATGKTRLEASQKLDRLKLSHSSPSDIMRKMTVGELLDRWLEDIISDRSANTLSGYTHSAEQKIAPTLGRHRLSDLNAEHIRIWLSKLTSGDATKQKAFDVLGGALRYALKSGLIATNPINQVDRPRHRREKIEPFSLAETRSILAVDWEYKPLMWLLFSLGLRQGEAYALRWSDLTGDQIRITRQAAETGGKIHYKAPKTEAGNRTLQIDPRLVELLHEQRKAALRKGRAKRQDLIFVSPAGEPMRRTNFARRQWKPLLKSLDLSERGLHHARHTAATLMLTAGVPAHVVSGILGHSSPTVTWNLYSHFVADQQELATKARQNYLSGAV